MEREKVLAQMASRLGLVEVDEVGALLERYRECLASTPTSQEENGSGSPLPLTFEQFALHEEIWDVPAVERLLTHFAAAFFQCDSCGHPQRGQQLGPADELTCTVCGATALSERRLEIEPNRSTLDGAAANVSALAPEDAHALGELIDEAKTSKDFDGVRTRLEALAERLGPHREIEAALHRIEQRLHDQRLAEAERVLFWGRLGQARRLYAQARQWAPEDPRVKELGGKLERVKGVLIGASGLAVVALLVVVLGLMLRTDPDELRAEQLTAALEHEDPRERVAALEEHLLTYPGDGTASDALAEAHETSRERALAEIVAIDDSEQRRLALEHHLARYPEDAEAQRQLDMVSARLEARSRLAELRERYQEVRHTTPAAERARALENYLREHRDELPPDLASDAQSDLRRARYEAVREQTRRELRGLEDPWQRYERLQTLATEFEEQSGDGHEQAKRWLDSRIDEGREALEEELRHAARELESAERGKAFLELLARTEALIPEVAERFRSQREQAERRITEKETLAEFEARVAEVARWYEAEALQAELAELAERVPRLRAAVDRLAERLEAPLAERPPEVPGFLPLRIEHFEVHGESHRVHVYRNERFAEAYELPELPLSPEQRQEPAGAFTRPEVEFVLLPPLGHDDIRFRMGSPETEAERREGETPHEVTLTRAYLIARTTVTQHLWQQLAPEVGGLEPQPARHEGDNLPVTGITWHQARSFARHLGLRLPREAEWEYAARAGTSTPFAFGETLPGELANTNTTLPYGEAAAEEPRGEPVAVASLPANGFGLFEVHGNVWEWCADWRDRLPAEAVTDPKGPERGLVRLLRGGSFRYPPHQARSAARGGLSPTGAAPDVGLRLAATVPQAE